MKLILNDGLIISTNRPPVPNSRVGRLWPNHRGAFSRIESKFLLEASKGPTYAAMWHRRSISRYNIIYREEGGTDLVEFLVFAEETVTRVFAVFVDRPVDALDRLNFFLIAAI